MKIKSALYGEIVFLVIIFISCTESRDVKPSIGTEILQTNILSDLLNKFGDDNLSMQNVAVLAKTAYGVDFDREYEKLLPRLITSHALQVEARGQDITMRDMALILQNNGVTSGTPLYQYLERVVNLFEIEQPDAAMISAFNRLKSEARSDQALSEQDREGLASTFTLLASNYVGIVNGVTAAMSPASNERSQGLFSVVWRVVRSVVISSAIGALIGAPFSYEAVAVGAAIAGGAAIADYRANNNCHFALQCDGGWRQDCMSGECKPYAK